MTLAIRSTLVRKYYRPNNITLMEFHHKLSIELTFTLYCGSIELVGISVLISANSESMFSTGWLWSGKPNICLTNSNLRSWNLDDIEQNKTLINFVDVFKSVNNLISTLDKGKY